MMISNPVFSEVIDPKLELIENTKDLRYADFQKMDLKNKDLSGADLTNAKLFGAALQYAILTDAILINTDLSGANIYETDFENANLDGASVLLTYSKYTNYENVIITQDTKTDSCFSTGLFDRVICYFYRTITPESPPFYGHFQKLPTGFQFEN
jgi:hypothetical protein